jgi:hypothetical protein
LSFNIETKQLLHLQEKLTGLRSRKLQFGVGVGSGEAKTGGLSNLIIGDVGTAGVGQANSQGGAYAKGRGFASSPGIGESFGGGIGSATGDTTTSGGNTDPISNMAFTYTNSGGAGRGIFGPGPAEVAALNNAKGGKNKGRTADVLLNGGPFGGATGGGGEGFSYSNTIGNGTGTSELYGINAVEGDAYGTSSGAGVGYGAGENTAGKAGGNAGGNSFGLGGGTFSADLGSGLFNSAGGGYGRGSAAGFLGETLGSYGYGN